MGRLAADLGLPPPAPWIFSDFAPGTLRVGIDPTEYSFGLRTARGRWKPAAAVVRDDFRHRTRADVDGAFSREHGDGGPTFGSWSLSDPSAGTAAIRPAGTAHGKVACLSRTAGDDRQVPAFTQNLPLVRSPTVALTAAVRLAAATGRTRIALAWFDAAHRYVGEDESPDAVNADGSWQLLHVAAHAPPGATEVQISLKSGDDAGTACFDDVRVAGAY
jgi:hypothetical protein